MSESEGLNNSELLKHQENSGKNDYFRIFFFIAVFALAIYMFVFNFGILGNVFLVLLGFGAVVFFHELGHFIFAKLSDIKVEAFSIGYPPTLLAILKTDKGWRVRVMPGLSKDNSGNDSDRCLFSFNIGKSAKPGETEYRIGIIPFGGFVKMLGQEDTKEVEKTDDPRSYANKPAGRRMAVIAGGVIFNALSAIIIFVTVFFVGINLMPPVVGGVRPGSPADLAGIKAGDEVVKIDGKTRNLEFMNIAEAAALSGKEKAIELKVKHPDGSTSKLSLVSEQFPGEPMRTFGISTPMSLIVAKLSQEDANILFVRTKLLPSDRIQSVNGRDVQTHWQMTDVVARSVEPNARLLVRRASTEKDENFELIETEIPLEFIVTSQSPREQQSFGDIYSMVPRLQIAALLEKPETYKDKIDSFLTNIGIHEKKVLQKPDLKIGDIILGLGDIEYPTFKEMRQMTEEYEDKELPIKVLRVDPNGIQRELTISVTPRRSSDGKVLIGIAPVLDIHHPVVAKIEPALDSNDMLDIPRGALIAAVDGVKVSDFADCVRQIRRSTSGLVKIDYQKDNQQASVVLNVKGWDNYDSVKFTFAEFIPFKPMERLYKADGTVEAVLMGCRKTSMFITQSVLTLKGFFSGYVSAKNFMGPVGILKMSYDIVSDFPFIYYIYFIGLINAFLAVFNSLPFLPFDGGHIVFLLIEKIKGSAVSERVQAAVLYVGLAAVITFAVYVTFNDIVRSFFT